MIGGTTAVRIASGVGGAVVGGLIGNEAEKAMRSDKGYEYIIQLDNGNDISVTQQQDLQLAVNQHVLVIYGAMTRIVADNTVSVPVATPAPAATTASSNKATTKTATSASKPTSSKTAASTTTTSTKS